MRIVNCDVGDLRICEDADYVMHLCRRVGNELVPTNLYCVTVCVLENDSPVDSVKVMVLAESAHRAEVQACCIVSRKRYGDNWQSDAVRMHPYAAEVPLGIQGWGSNEF